MAIEKLRINYKA